MMTSSNGNISALLALCEGNPSVTGGFPSQMASDAELSYVSLIYAWTNGWGNNRNAGDLRRHCANYDFTVMTFSFSHGLSWLSYYLLVKGILCDNWIMAKWCKLEIVYGADCRCKSNHFFRYWRIYITGLIYPYGMQRSNKSANEPLVGPFPMNQRSSIE